MVNFYNNVQYKLIQMFKHDTATYACMYADKNATLPPHLL